jgi:arylsulfatase A-like enzyme
MPEITSICCWFNLSLISIQQFRTMINKVVHTVFLAFLLSGLCSCGSKKEKPPNIIFIMADDLGYNELGCYGQEIIQTPNIDKLASEGMRFTQFYSGSPVCAPSRCVLLTGKHTGHAFIRDNFELGGWADSTEGGQLALPSGTETIAKKLKKQGYVTAAIGKWGLGGPGSEGVPKKQGFDYFYGYLCQKQAHNYYPTHLWENDKWDTLDNEYFMPHQKLVGDSSDLSAYKQYSGKDYAPDKMFEIVREFIKANKDTSFFLYLPYTIPHLALQVPDDEPSLVYYREIIPDTPYIGDQGYLPHPTPRAAYAAMITRMDREVEKIMDFLKQFGIEKNTVVFFTSDNGPTHDGVGGSDSEYFNSAKPFRGLKGSLYEGGIRVPMIVHWPGVIESGTVSEHVAAFQDIFPTLLGISGKNSVYETDGLSFYPELLGGMQPKHDYLYWEFPGYGGQVAVRIENWKAIKTGLNKNFEAPIELYNLAEDESESQNVAEDFPLVIENTRKIISEAHTPSDYFPFPALDSLVTTLSDKKE